MRARSLYLHFPFCETKCHYCDFYSLGRERTREGDAPTFESALRREVELCAPQVAAEIDTIFMGGGTPSMTPAAAMAQALEPLWRSSRLAPDYEWTMEANPSSLTPESLREYRELGVNRISMGVQALRDDLLLRLGRVHSRDRALSALAEIFEAGFRNVSVDLLCGVPGQAITDIERALQTLSAFPITHLSCYLLTLPPHHKMYKELPDEDTQLEHLLFVDRFMSQQGFEHYEISNYARGPEMRARHNLVYWRGQSYLGLGPSAHSYDAESQKRWKNVSSLHGYAQRLTRSELPREQEESLSASQLELEKWLLGVRLTEGFPLSWLESEFQKKRAERLIQEGFLTQGGAGLRLTPRGFAMSDAIVRQLSG